ncbi:uncharacterized protein LOC132061371 [Lycium ferocissimum]|uniref:uncharacterized protein LOC132061371 n=1 Tax=Lycium ferocissimum TaxID=112874 RepID=UPI0028153E34|nr:uncharacterized protein LOC132061371 [Lycium ferocissimum]
MIGGDNVITSEEEKYRGLPVRLNEVQDFLSCIQNCGITDLGFKGSKYTWWNGQNGKDCIFKRLDRCFGNQFLRSLYPGIEVNYLIRTGSGHSPLLVSYTGTTNPIKKPFKFLNFWTKNDSFLDTVRVQWETDFMANPFTLFHHKMKKVKGRRKRLQIKRIQDQKGNWIEDNDGIADEAINFFEKQFTKEDDPGRSIVENILLTQEIVSNIRLRTKTANVVLKLDMAKAYDRVAGLFLTKVLRQMGF